MESRSIVARVVARVRARIAVLALVIVAIAVVVVVPVVALAQDQNPVDLLGGLLGAVQGKHWAVVAGIVLSLITYAIRTWVVPNWGWAKTDRGGATLALIVAALGTVGVALGTGTASLWTIVDALASTMLSAGAYTLYHKARNPADAPPKKV